ncbi:MAG: LysE family transporter [Pseudomonadota bacterium]
MLPALLSGALLGLAAGFSPGPLSVLVITCTLRHGLREGLKVALVPALSDAPLVALSVYMLSGLEDHARLLGAISLAGAVVVARLGLGTLRTRDMPLAETAETPRSLRQGLWVNLLSPHPYLFWFTVGAPQVVLFSTEGWGGGAAFIAGFYLCLVGSKLVMALVTARAKAFISGRAYAYVMRALGLLLMIFSLMLFKDALALFGWL